MEGEFKGQFAGVARIFVRCFLGLVLVAGVALLSLAWLLRDWSVGGKPNPALAEVLELESMASEAEQRGEIDEAITYYLEAIGVCDREDFRSAGGERAACNAALAKIYDGRGELEVALRYYEAFEEDRGKLGHLNDVIRCRVQLFGVAALGPWIAEKEPELFRDESYVRVQQYLIEYSHGFLAVASAEEFLGHCRLSDEVVALLQIEHHGGAPLGQRFTSSRAKQNALDILALARLELGQTAQAEGAARAAIAFAEDRPRSRLDNGPAKGGSTGRNILARIARESGAEAKTAPATDLAIPQSTQD